MFRFNIRDLLWLTLLAAIMVAWWVDRRAQARRIEELEKSAIGWTVWGDIDLSQNTLTIDSAKMKFKSPSP